MMPDQAIFGLRCWCYRFLAAVYQRDEVVERASCARRGVSRSGEHYVAKKAKKKIVRREYSKADVKELRAHSKAKTPVEKIVKLTKRTAGSLRQKALKLGIGLGHQR